jgi:Leucine-rich repeat (LRR) protein
MRPEIKKLAFRKALNKWYKAYSPILQRNLPYTAFMNTLQVYVDQQPILDLSNLNLKSLPPCIGEMNWLKEIYLHGNQLAEVPAFLGQLPRLDKVTLYGNRFLAPNDPYASLPLA